MFVSSCSCVPGFGTAPRGSTRFGTSASAAETTTSADARASVATRTRARTRRAIRWDGFRRFMAFSSLRGDEAHVEGQGAAAGAVEREAPFARPGPLAGGDRGGERRRAGPRRAVERRVQGEG